jgi:hypothetical protein
MADVKPDQFLIYAMWVLVLFPALAAAWPPQRAAVRAWGIALLSPLLLWPFVLPLKALAEPVGENVSHPAIKASAVAPVVLWLLTAPILFVTRALAVRRPVALAARVGWALGGVVLVLHIAIAFHLGHGWSHAAAWDHTQQVGGYGWGVFVNYAFALVWLADAAWASVYFDSYNARARGLHWAIYAFLAFVVVNAVFVFGGAGISGAATIIVFLYFPYLALWLWAEHGFGRGKTTDIDPK